MRRARGNPSDDFWGPAVGAVLIAFFSLFVGRDGLHLLYLSNSFDRLPHTQGKIVSSEILTNKRRKYRNGSEEVTYNTYEVIYVYFVGSRRYSNTHLTFCDAACEDLPVLKALLTRFPVGKVVDVHFDPNDPSVSAIEPGQAPGYFNDFLFFAGLPTICVLMCLALASYNYPRYKRYKEDPNSIL